MKKLIIGQTHKASPGQNLECDCCGNRVTSGDESTGLFFSQHGRVLRGGKIEDREVVIFAYCSDCLKEVASFSSGYTGENYVCIDHDNRHIRTHFKIIGRPVFSSFSDSELREKAIALKAQTNYLWVD